MISSVCTIVTSSGACKLLITKTTPIYNVSKRKVSIYFIDKLQEYILRQFRLNCGEETLNQQMSEFMNLVEIEILAQAKIFFSFEDDTWADQVKIERKVFSLVSGLAVEDKNLKILIGRNLNDPRVQ